MLVPILGVPVCFVVYELLSSLLEPESTKATTHVSRMIESRKNNSVGGG